MCAGITAIRRELHRLHAAASCGSQCPRAGAATLIAWPGSSPPSKDRSVHRDGGQAVGLHRSLLGSAPRARAHASKLAAPGLCSTVSAPGIHRRNRPLVSCPALHQHLQRRLLGKRSASGRRRLSGSGGQATNLAEAIHRLVLWVGDLSTAGVPLIRLVGLAWLRALMRLRD